MNIQAQPITYSWPYCMRSHSKVSNAIITLPVYCIYWWSFVGLGVAAAEFNSHVGQLVINLITANNNNSGNDIAHWIEASLLSCLLMIDEQSIFISKNFFFALMFWRKVPTVMVATSHIITEHESFSCIHQLMSICTSLNTSLPAHVISIDSVV